MKRLSTFKGYVAITNNKLLVFSVRFPRSGICVGKNKKRVTRVNIIMICDDFLCISLKTNCAGIAPRLS